MLLLTLLAWTAQIGIFVALPLLGAFPPAKEALLLESCLQSTNAIVLVSKQKQKLLLSLELLLVT
jgi:hypothetical protein